MADFVVGDTESKVKYKLRNRSTGDSIDITGAVSTLRYKIGESATRVRLMTNEAPESGGIVRYQFVAGDLEPGLMEAEVQTVLASGKRLTSADTVRYVVRPQL